MIKCKCLKSGAAEIVQHLGAPPVPAEGRSSVSITHTEYLMMTCNSTPKGFDVLL